MTTFILTQTGFLQTTTAESIVLGAMRLINVKTPDADVATDELLDGLQALNDLLESWAEGEKPTLYQLTRETFTTTPGLQVHTWGTGGTFNSARPVKIAWGSVQIGGVDVPLDIVEADVYESIGVKTTGNAGGSNVLYCDYAYPLANLYLYPVPGGESVSFQSYKALPAFGALQDAVLLPPGYRRALRYNLAIELAPEYQVSAPAEVLSIAAQAKRNLKNNNRRTPTLQVPRLFGGGWYDQASDRVL